jgi:hypothetical protein
MSKEQEDAYNVMENMRRLIDGQGIMIQMDAVNSHLDEEAKIEGQG